MKIFITGGLGFIGKHLLPLFSSEDEVYVLVHNMPLIDPKEFKLSNFHILLGDLAYTEKWFSELEKIRPDVCIHLAWQGIPDFSFYQSHWNLSASANLFRHLAEKCGCKKIISIGSCFEYGKNFARCSEEDTLVLNSYFSWAKSSLCNFGMMLAQKYKINFLWARPFYIYGEGQRIGSLIPNVYHKLRILEPLVIKTPHNRIDLIHVSDVAKALMIMTKERNGTSGILNLGSGNSIPVWKIVEYVEKAMGREPEASIFLKAHEPFDYNEDIRADIRKAHELIGWLPIISLEEGIRDYIKNTT